MPSADASVTLVAAETPRLLMQGAQDSGPYLSMGEAVAAIGLLLAFYQLMTPGVRFRFRVHPWRSTTAIGLGLAAVALSAVAAWSRSYASSQVWLPPLVWESLGTLCIVLAAAVLASGHWRQMYFTPGNAQRFAEHVRAVVTRGDPVEMAEVLGDLRGSMHAVFEAVARYDPSDRGRYIHPKSLTLMQTQTYHAAFVLASLGDETCCRLMVTRAPETAKVILELCAKYPDASHVDALVRQLLRQAMLQPDSIFHREMGYSGLARFRRLIDIVYGDVRFVESDSTPLACLNSADAGPVAAIAMREALGVASRAHAVQGGGMTSTTALSMGYDTLASMGMYTLWHHAERHPEDVLYSQPFALTREYAHAVMDLLDLVMSLPGAQATDFPREAYHVTTDPTLWARAVEALLQLLSMVSHPSIGADAVQSLAAMAWHFVNRAPAPHYEVAYAQVQARLRGALMTPQYPEIGPLQTCSAALVVFVGLREWPNHRYPIVTPRELRQHLLKELEGTAQADTRHTRRLLPRGYAYDATTRSILIHDDNNPSATPRVVVLDK